MTHLFTYRNRKISTVDVKYIRRLIKAHPEFGRCRLSREICTFWQWIQPNGHLKDMVCRGLLIRLEKEGHITLPPQIVKPANPFLNRRQPGKIVVDETLLSTGLRNLGPITIQQVRRTPQETLFNALIEQYHYLGYQQPVGEHLKHIIWAQNRPVACLAWSSAAWHLNCRDRYIGWAPITRKANLHLIAYNTRFLILPWVHVPHLASHILSRCLKTIASDWQTLYHHPIYWVETFIDTSRYKGSCYRAANWRYLGQTTGRGKNDQTNTVNRSIKDVYGYPLVHDFRDKLGGIQ